LLCSFRNSWDNLVVAIGSTTQFALKYEDVVSSLLSKDMRGKSMDSHSKDALFVRGRPKDRDTNKSLRGGNLNLKVGLNPQENL
jgi:hypothetical protein